MEMSKLRVHVTNDEDSEEVAKALNDSIKVLKVGLPNMVNQKLNDTWQIPK